MKLNLLTLEGFCGSVRILRATDFLRQRRLQAEGFGIEIEVVGNDVVQSATKSDAGDTGESATTTLASVIAENGFVVESDLLRANVTADASISSISVTVATQAPTPTLTGDPTSAAASANGTTADADPTAAPTAAPTTAPTIAPTTAPIATPPLPPAQDANVEGSGSASLMFLAFFFKVVS